MPFLFLRGLLKIYRAKGDCNLLQIMAKYVNLAPDELILFVVWLVQSFSRSSSHFCAVLSSSKGTGKSTLTKLIRAIVDPSKSGVSLLSNSEGDLKTLLGNSYMVAFDNTAVLSTKVCNILCAAITGSKKAKRKLYTDCDQIILNLHNLVVITTNCRKPCTWIRSLCP